MATTLLDRYRLEAELGRGGMGVVYRAHDALLDRDVAIKILTDPRLGSTGRARLLNEARAVARLNHPNIIAIFDVAEASVLVDASDNHVSSLDWTAQGKPFIVMELAQGITMDQHNPGSLAETLSIARQICAALDHAHDHGIIHRDLKPENVVITPDGTAKLMDFGLARLVASEDAEPLFVGTVLYLAPEQARGEAVDGRADLYALGVMLYEAVTGSLPFTGNDPMAVIAQHLHTRPAPVRSLRPELPAELDDIILKLLEKDPGQRYATAREVKAALAAVPGDGPAYISQPNNLPAEVSSFIGREKEIAAVRQLLNGTRLLTLTGTGGMGKTRLALRAASDTQASFPDGTWLVDLAPLADGNLLAQSVAGVLKIRDEPGVPLQRRITETLHHKNLLLLLDNCEHIIEAVAELASELMRGCPDIKLLVTSREALGIPGETVYRVPSLSLPPDSSHPAIGVEAAGQYEAVRLFVERAATVRPEFALTESNAAAVAQICRQLDGVPLALELAAARVRAMGVEQIAARLDNRFQLLTGGSRTALPRQQTLRALIDWSWDLLSAEEKQIFRRLSVFVGGWNLEAAEFLCSAREAHPSLDVLELLTRLVDKSLVIVDEQEGEARFRMLETIRQYALEKLVEAGEAEVKEVRGRQLEFFLRLVELAEPELKAAGQINWLTRLEMEHDNLRAALKWAGAATSPVKSQESGLRLAGALSRFWYLHGYWSEGRAWLKRTLADALPENAPVSLKLARAKALAGLAWLMDENGEDIPLYNASLALYREIGDRSGAAFTLRGLGAGHLNQGEADQAAVYLNEALDQYRIISDRWGQALTQFSLGWLTFYQDDIARAVTIWEDSISSFRQSGDRWGIAVAMGGLSYAARSRGDYARAAALSEESLEHFRAIGDKAGTATSLSRLGNVAFRRGDYLQAQSLIEESIVYQRDLNEQDGLAYAYAVLGQISAYQGNYDRAKSWLDQSLALAHEIEDDDMIAFVLSSLAWANYYANELEQAAKLWRSALELLPEHKDRLNTGYALNGLGLVALRRGDPEIAEQQIRQSLALYKEAGDKRYIAIGLISQGRVTYALNDSGEAAALIRKALGITRDLGDRQNLVEAMEVLAFTNGQTPLAARLLGAAEALRAAMGTPLPLVEQPDYEKNTADLQQALGTEGFSSAWSEGQRQPLEKTILDALNEESNRKTS